MRALAQTQDQLQRQASSSPARLDAAPSGPDYRTQPIRELQRTLGNRAVQRRLETNAQELSEGSSGTAVGRFTPAASRAPVVAQMPVMIQQKLAVNAPGDVYEQEADRVAEQVMRMSDPAAPLQRTATGQAEGATAPLIAQDVLRSPGQPLDPAVSAFMDPRFGMDLSQVRVHTHAQASKSAEAIRAEAYTVGKDVVQRQTLEGSPPEPLSAGISYRPEPDAFDSITLHYVVGDGYFSGKDLISPPVVYKSKHFWLIPGIRKSTGGVVAYVAYNPEVRRNEWVIGPGLLSFFFAHEFLYLSISGATYPLGGGEPAPFQMQHARMILSAFRGNLEGMVTHFGYSWRAAFVDPGWWVQGVGAFATMPTAPKPNASITPVPKAGSTTGTQMPQTGAGSATPVPKSAIPSSSGTPASPVFYGSAGKASPSNVEFPSLPIVKTPAPFGIGVTSPMASKSKIPVAIGPNGEAIPPTSYVGGYHAPGENLTMDQMFREGLPARGTDFRLYQHVQPGSELPPSSGSVFRGTTHTPSTMPGGVGGQGAADWAGEGGLVVHIKGIPTWQVEQALEGRIRMPDGSFRGPLVNVEGEGAILAKVPSENIVRIGKVSLDSRGRLVVKPEDWVPNPNYKPVP